MATILITEDEPSIREGLCSAIDHHGFNILTAEDGKQALKLLKSEEIDLLVSDIRMPEMDIAREVLFRNRDHPVFVRTHDPLLSQTGPAKARQRNAGTGGGEGHAIRPDLSGPIGAVPAARA